MMYQQAQRSVGARRAAVTSAQEEISTGRRVNRPSDDPQAARRILRAESLLYDIEAHRASLNQGERLLSITEDSLTTVGNLMQRVSEMSVQFANDTYNLEDRQQAADELVQIREQLVDLANTEDNGRYVFGGLGSGTAPFDAAGNFGGDPGVLEVPVGKGARIEVTLPGGEPFVLGTTGPSLFTTLDSLETALRADNNAAVGALVDEVRGHEDNIRMSRQALGHRFARVENMREALERVEVTATETLLEDRDIDLTESIIRLQQAETGLQGALLVTARLDELNLLNFL